MNKLPNLSISKKTAKISLVVSIISFIGIFIPELVGIDGFNGGFAISTFCIFIFISGVVTSLVFWRMSVKEDKIISGTNLIAHWTYSKEEWKKFTEVEFKTDKSYKNMLFYIILFFALFFGIIFYIFDPENGIYVFYVMIGLIVLMFFVAKYSIWSAHKSNLKSLGEVYISPDGVIVNGLFHAWNMIGAKLEDINYDEKSNPKFLEFEYSTIARYGRQSNYVRIPVPKSEEKNVDEIIKKISLGITKYK